MKVIVLHTIQVILSMQRENIIVLIRPEAEPVTRGNFKKLCKEFDLPYHSLKMKKFPIYYKDLVIYKVAFNESK